MSILPSSRSVSRLAVPAAAVLLLGAMASPSAHAAVLSWDGGDATANTTYGGSGNWDTNDLVNFTNTTGPTEVKWTDTTGTDTAVFAGTAGTVTITNTTSVAPLVANALRFDLAGYTIAGGYLKLAGTTPTIITSGITGLSGAASTVTVATISANLVGSVAITRTGSGGLITLSGDNSLYSGGFTTTNAGGFNLNSPTALGTGTFDINSGSQAPIDNSSGSPLVLTTNAPLKVETGLNFLGSNDLTFGTGTVTSTGQRGLTVNANTLTFNGILAGSTTPRGYTKGGAGSLVLNGNNTYGGPSTFGLGTTLVNGVYATAATGAVTVGSSTDATQVATLGGTGTLRGTTAVYGGSIISPGGTSAGNVVTQTTGTLTTGILTLSSGATYQAQINSSTSFDQVSAVGGATITGSTLSLTLGTGVKTGDLYFILLDDGTNATTGTFANYTDTTRTTQYTVNGVTFTISYTADSTTNSLTGGNDMALSIAAVPEPSTWAQILLGAGALGYFLRGRIARRV